MNETSSVNVCEMNDTSKFMPTLICLYYDHFRKCLQLSLAAPLLPFFSSSVHEIAINIQKYATLKEQQYPCIVTDTVSSYYRPENFSGRYCFQSRLYVDFLSSIITLFSYKYLINIYQTFSHNL